MKIRELDKRLAAALQPLLPGTVLLVGAKSQSLNAVTSLERPEQSAAGWHDSALWVAPPEALVLRLGIAALRGKLKPGAPLVLAVRRRAPLWQQLRGSLGGPKPAPVELETVCGALLASGLALPRVHPSLRGYHVLSGTLPRDPCALDSFFTQPSTC